MHAAGRTAVEVSRPAVRLATEEGDMPRGPARFAYGETRMLSEYLAWEYGTDRVWERLRLGPLQPLIQDHSLDAADLAQLGSFRRFADAVVAREQELVIIEAKMRSRPDACAQLLLYRDLARVTPEISAWWSLPIVMELVVAVEDPAVTRLCNELGVRHRVYRPDWLALWQASLHRREARAPRDFGQAAAAAES